MKHDRGIDSYGLFLWKTALILLLITGTGISAAGSNEKTANTLIWDTISPLSDTVDLQNRTSWKLVPTDLLMLERDPVAASSDPGYYGREYTFNGDAVVENEHLTAVFQSKKGCVVIYSKADSKSKKLEFVPLELKSTPARMTLPAVGASTCASGSHVWNGNIGTLIAKAKKNARNANP